MRKRLVATLVGALALAPALATAPAACFPQGQCAFSWVDYCGVDPTPDGGVPCTGHLIDPYTWESGPIDGAWLGYPHNYNLTAHLRDAVTGQTIQGGPFAYEYLAYISPDPNPISNHTQFTIAGGNLAVWMPQADGSVIIRNDTCADYFLYFVVHAAPNGSQDAGADGASQDAGTDAATDGAPDATID